MQTGQASVDHPLRNYTHMMLCQEKKKQIEKQIHVICCEQGEHETYLSTKN